MRTKLRGFLWIPVVQQTWNEIYIIHDIRSAYSISLKAFHDNSWLFWGLSNVWISGGQSCTMWEILPENAMMEGRPLDTTFPRGLVWMGVEMDPSHWDYRCWGGALGRWKMLLQPSTTAGLPMSHGAMGWSLDRRWKQRNIAAMNPIARGSLGADWISWYIKKHFITVWQASLKIKLQ